MKGFRHSLSTSVRVAAFLCAAFAALAPAASAQDKPAAPDKPASASWGFRDVYGIPLNILEETGEIELISLASRSHDGYGGLLEFEYSLSRRFSIEGEFPWRFGRPAFPGFDLEATYAVVRDDARRLMVLAGAEFFIPTRSGGELEAEPYLGFLKCFPSLFLLGKLSLSLESGKDPEVNVMDELHPALALGPYFPIGDRVVLGLPLTVGKDVDRTAFKSGLDLNVRVTDELRIFLIGQAIFSRKTDFAISLGCYLEID